MPSTRLSSEEIAARRTALGDGWTVENDTLRRLFTFPDFVAAMRFVNRLADAAEALQHHPDLDIRYNKVTVALTTHDAGGLTALDFQMAETANTI